jgi:hypothetical protein
MNVPIIIIRNRNTLIRVTKELSFLLLGKSLWNTLTEIWLKYLLVKRNNEKTIIPTISFGVISANFTYQFSRTL